MKKQEDILTHIRFAITIKIVLSLQMYLMITATEIIYPEIKTNGLYLLNLSDDKKYTFYDIKSDGWIYSAVPYKDGIIFAEYTGVPDEGGYGWSICYIDGKNKTILDSGCSRTWFTTHLTLLDNKMPIYVCEKIKPCPKTKRWWRMAGSSGKYCTVIDSGFNPYYIDIENSCVGEILLPEEMESGFLVKSFYPIEKDKFILDINYMDFYIMDLRNK